MQWLHELAGELKDRVAADTAANSRVPRQLHLGLSVVARPTASALAAKQSAKRYTNTLAAAGGKY